MRYTLTATCQASVTEVWEIDIPDDVDTSDWNQNEWTEAISDYTASCVAEDVFDEHDREIKEVVSGVSFDKLVFSA